MRVVFLFLVLANVGFFAWSRYFSPPDASADPQPLGRQIEPEKLKIIAPAPLDAPPPAAAAKPAASPAPLAAVPPPAASACMEWGSFSVADASRAEKVLEPLSLGERLAQRRTEEVAGWWVFIPPQGNRPGALKKAGELKARGVDDYFIIADEGQYRWSVSLGVFRNEEAAQARLAALRAKGVRSAQAGPRETLVPKIWLQVKGVDRALEARLKELTRQIDGADLKPCASF